MFPKTAYYYATFGKYILKKRIYQGVQSVKRNIALFIPYYPTKRPYPFDLERKHKVQAVMFRHGIFTAKKLSELLHMNYYVVNEVINGTRLSRKTEERIAAFFGMTRDELFPERTIAELAEMNRAQLEAKQRREN